MTRSGPVLLAVVGLAALAPLATAGSPSHVGVDRTHHVRFSLVARTLTITLEPVDGQANPLVASLAGATLDTACNGKSPRTGKKVVASQLSVSWPADTPTLKIKLNKDVSAHVQWCVVEHADTGADVALSEKMRVPNPSAPPATG